MKTDTDRTERISLGLQAICPSAHPHKCLSLARLITEQPEAEKLASIEELPEPEKGWRYKLDADGKPQFRAPGPDEPWMGSVGPDGRRHDDERGWESAPPIFTGHPTKCAYGNRRWIVERIPDPLPTGLTLIQAVEWLREHAHTHEAWTKARYYGAGPRRLRYVSHELAMTSAEGVSYAFAPEEILGLWDIKERADHA